MLEGISYLQGKSLWKKSPNGLVTADQTLAKRFNLFHMSVFNNIGLGFIFPGTIGATYYSVPSMATKLLYRPTDLSQKVTPSGIGWLSLGTRAAGLEYGHARTSYTWEEISLLAVITPQYSNLTRIAAATGGGRTATLDGAANFGFAINNLAGNSNVWGGNCAQNNFDGTLPYVIGRSDVLILTATKNVGYTFFVNGEIAATGAADTNTGFEMRSGPCVARTNGSNYSSPHTSIAYLANRNWTLDEVAELTENPFKTILPARTPTFYSLPTRKPEPVGLGYTKRVWTRQPQYPAQLDPQLSKGATGIWVPTAGRRNLAGGADLAAMGDGAPTPSVGVGGRSWANSGLNLAGTASPGWDTGVSIPSVSASTFLIVFQPFDAPSSAGYGAPMMATWAGLSYHHSSNSYQRAFLINKSSVWRVAQFTKPVANQLCVWVGVYDGANVIAYENGREIVGVAVTGTITGGGTSIKILSRDDGYNFNGAVYLAAYWPTAIPRAHRLELSARPWQLFRLSRTPTFYSLPNRWPSTTGLTMSRKPYAVQQDTKLALVDHNEPLTRRLISAPRSAFNGHIFDAADKSRVWTKYSGNVAIRKSAKYGDVFDFNAGPFISAPGSVFNILGYYGDVTLAVQIEAKAGAEGVVFELTNEAQTVYALIGVDANGAVYAHHRGGSTYTTTDPAGLRPGMHTYVVVFRMIEWVPEASANRAIHELYVDGVLVASNYWDWGSLSWDWIDRFVVGAHVYVYTPLPDGGGKGAYRAANPMLWARRLSSQEIQRVSANPSVVMQATNFAPQFQTLTSGHNIPRLLDPTVIDVETTEVTPRVTLDF